jgi:hypothetical protein
VTDKALENAKALKMQANQEIARLEAEIRTWRVNLDRAEQFIDQWNAFASGEAVNPVEGVSAQENKQEPSPVKKKATRNSKKEDVAAAALEIIRERGEPVSRSDLYTALIERGFTIEGTDPEMVLSTMLWRMKDKVMRFKNGGYWDPKADWEPAGYKSEWRDETEGRERDFSGVDLSGDLLE